MLCEDWDVSAIVVGTDGSDTGRAAEDYAFGLARATGATVVVVTAWRELTGDFGLPYERLLAPDVADVEREWAEAVVSAAAARGAEAGVDVATECRHGQAAEAILEVARERGATTIVVGSHGFGRVEGILLGSVSRAVLRHATCPVVVVPPPAV